MFVKCIVLAISIRIPDPWTSRIANLPDHCRDSGLHPRRPRLHRSQPAISRRLDQLEHELGAHAVRTHSRPRPAHRSGPRLPAPRRGGAGRAEGWAGCGARSADGPAGRRLARAGRHPGRYPHRRHAAPLRPQGRQGAARIAHGLERGSHRPGAARRGDARLALLRERPAGPGRARGRQRSDARRGGRGHRAGRPPPARAEDLAGERWIGFPPSPRRPRFIRAIFWRGNSFAPASRTPT